MNLPDDKRLRRRSVLENAVLIAGGLALSIMALALSNTSIEVALRDGETGVLEWGPTLFRTLLALHGLVLISLAIGRFVCQDSEARIQANIPTKSGPRRGPWLLLISLCILAIFLRLYRLGTDLWIDEVITLVQFVRPPCSTR